MVSTLSGIPKRPNLNKTSFQISNRGSKWWVPYLESQKDRISIRPAFLPTAIRIWQEKRFFFQMTRLHKCQQGKDEKECLSFYLISPSKDTIPFQMTYKQMLQVSITFDYLTKEGMGFILHFISFLLFNNHFQTSSVEELRSSINNIWWSLYWGKLLNPLEHKSLFRYT